MKIGELNVFYVKKARSNVISYDIGISPLPYDLNYI